MPAQGQAELTIKSTGKIDPALVEAQKRVPQPRDLGAKDALAIADIRREDGERFPRILVDVVAPAGQNVELFAEGPSSDWALPVPEAVDGAPAGRQRFAFALDEVLPPLERAVLHLPCEMQVGSGLGGIGDAGRLAGLLLMAGPVRARHRVLLTYSGSQNGSRYSGAVRRSSRTVTTSRSDVVTTYMLWSIGAY